MATINSLPKWQLRDTITNMSPSNTKVRCRQIRPRDHQLRINDIKNTVLHLNQELKKLNRPLAQRSFSEFLLWLARSTKYECPNALRLKEIEAARWLRTYIKQVDDARGEEAITQGLRRVSIGADRVQMSLWLSMKRSKSLLRS